MPNLTDPNVTDTTPVRNRYADTMNRPHRRLPRPVRIGLTVLILAALVAGAAYVAATPPPRPAPSLVKT